MKDKQKINLNNTVSAIVKEQNWKPYSLKLPLDTIKQKSLNKVRTCDLIIMLTNNVMPVSGAKVAVW